MYDGVIIPFDNDTFDKIMLKCVLEHVDNPASVLKEASRVLKINGTMIIEVPFINPIHAAPDDFFRYTSNGLKNLLRIRNFTLLVYSILMIIIGPSNGYYGHA